jgi:hypothetical protein
MIHQHLFGTKHKQYSSSIRSFTTTTDLSSMYEQRITKKIYTTRYIMVGQENEESMYLLK